MKNQSIFSLPNHSSLSINFVDYFCLKSIYPIIITLLFLVKKIFVNKNGFFDLLCFTFEFLSPKTMIKKENKDIFEKTVSKFGRQLISIAKFLINK